jgi:hypothetical protein
MKKPTAKITYCNNGDCGDCPSAAICYSIAQRPSLPKLAPSAKRA